MRMKTKSGLREEEVVCKIDYRKLLKNGWIVSEGDPSILPEDIGAEIASAARSYEYRPYAGRETEVQKQVAQSLHVDLTRERDDCNPGPGPAQDTGKTTEEILRDAETDEAEE